MTVSMSRGLLSWIRSRQAGPTAAGSVELYPVRPVLVANVRSAAVLGVFSGAVAIAALGWNAADVASGAAIGTVLWGIAYFLGVRDVVPRGTLLAMPDNAHLNADSWLDAWPRRLARTLWVLAPCAGATWLADRWDLGALFAPGLFFGIAAA